MTEKKKILVADDEQGIRDMIKYCLEPKGFEVFTANDGQEAVERVKNESFNIVILDVHMPRLRGPEALKAIKEIKPEQIVIVFSSGSDPGYVFEADATQLGAFGCLYKPFDIDELSTLIDRALSESPEKS